MCEIENIKNYILFLKRECGLYVTLHPFGNESLITSSELITFNIHDNPYCVYVKSFDAAHKHCVQRQHKIREKCGGGSFCGSCYAGVFEFVYPITGGGSEVLGFLSVSGYLSENMTSYIKRASEKYGIPCEGLSALSSGLKREIPQKKQIDTLIFPLCDMLTLAYIKSEAPARAEEALMERVLRYIKQHHTQPITLQEVCEKFFCSRSYISHNFKRKMGKSFRDFLIDLRLADARSLLEYSELCITDIALSVGFADSAYFASVFKTKLGVSPTAYRKNARSAEQRRERPLF